MYNPMQSRIDSLNQQKAMIDQQLNALSQYQMPPININNNMTPNMPTNFDFNGKWVGNENEAKGVANNNLPLILFDKNEPIFYMKNLDGTFKKFKFEEVVEQSTNETSRIDILEDKLNTILNALQGTNDTQGTITPQTQESCSNEPKTSKKGVKNNG